MRLTSARAAYSCRATAARVRGGQWRQHRERAAAEVRAVKGVEQGPGSGFHLSVCRVVRLAVMSDLGDGSSYRDGRVVRLVGREEQCRVDGHRVVPLQVGLDRRIVLRDATDEL